MPLPRPLHRLGWLAGLPLLAALWAGATFVAAPMLAARVEAEGRAVAATTDLGGEPWLRVRARGRDLVAEGEAPDEAARADVLARLAELPAPRRVVSAIGVVETASPFAWSATRGEAGLALGGDRPAEVGRGMLRARLAEAGAAVAQDASRAARGAPPDFPAAAAWAAARLGALGRGGRASVTDTVIGLEGEALDGAAYDALRRALDSPPHGYTIGRVEILPPPVADFRFSVERVAGGGLIIGGNVASEAARGEVRRLAAASADGAFVDDRARTARGLPEGIAPSALARAAFAVADLLRTGTVAYEGGRLSVTGDALDAQAVGEVEALVRSRLPAGIAAGAVALTASPLVPYRTSLRRDADSVTLAGHVPDEAARARLVAAVRPRFFRERIVDRLRVGEGAPDGLLPALEAAVPMLAGLAAGEVAAADRTLTLTGDSLYRESAARAAPTLQSRLPPGWTGRAAVQAREAPERRDAQACEGEFAALAAGPTLRFLPGALAVPPGFYPVLDALAALAKACPGLRIAVSGHADPAGTKAVRVAEGEGFAPAAAAAPAPAAEAAAAPTGAGGRAGARPEAGKAEMKTETKAETKAGTPSDGAPAKPKPDAARTAKAAPEAVKAKKPAPDARKAEAAAADTPAPDLARARALALVEYLLQAGAAPDQVAPGPDASGRVVFAPRP